MKRLHTHYDNLKVAQNAPPEVIRAAFKTLSQKFHPDRHGGDVRATRTFQLITVAYDVLSDPQRRRQHDEWIARNERRLDKEAMEAIAARAQRPWNGKERRAKSWSSLTPSFKPSLKPSISPAAAAVVSARLKIHPKTLTFWTATLITTVILLMLFQS